MVDCYIAVRSVTYAQKLIRLLGTHGIRARQTKSPKELTGGGCGHAVLVKDGDPIRLRAILDGSGLPPFRIFLTNDKVNFREYLSL
ncbi:MAG: DUF3343 domain-containing protein [Clostridia bacterium]|nr:DUF3343 domain-containing protein [Clostridia bacterium]